MARKLGDRPEGGVIKKRHLLHDLRIHSFLKTVNSLISNHVYKRLTSRDFALQQVFFLLQWGQDEANPGTVANEVCSNQGRWLHLL